jgi:lipopolysaccharide heptosyltransferase II
VLVPGASNGSAKRWPVPYWTKLGDRLERERGLAVVVTGSASERDLAAAVVSGMEAPALNLAGQTNLEELRALLVEATLVISGDTGPLHLASALGRPVVGIFGPTDPVNTGPLAPTAATVRLGLSCSPCYDLQSPAECKLPDRSVACMWGLRPERVFAAACEVLDRDEG